MNTALTHISLAKEKGVESNQRLEFLGDSILSYIIANKLYEIYPEFSEGTLTEARAFLVCEKTLAALADEMNLGPFIKFSKTEIATDGKRKNSILADTFEALLGAIFLDSDIAVAEKWVLDTYRDRIEKLDLSEIISYKSALQNYIQAKYQDKKAITYKMINKKGPDHKPVFTVEVRIDGTAAGKGSGTSLKLAEKEAARSAYTKLVKTNIY